MKTLEEIEFVIKDCVETICTNINNKKNRVYLRDIYSCLGDLIKHIEKAEMEICDV